LQKITIWGLSSILCALIPTMSLAATSPAPLDPTATVTTPTTAPTTTPAAVPPATPNVGEITQSATTTTSACSAKATSAGCINGAVETLSTAGVKLTPGATEAIGKATTLANLQAMKTNTDLAAQATTDANTVAGTTYDNSLDAINATNQSLAGVVAGQERIYAATTNNTLLQAQNLKQLAANYQATDAADRQKNTELSSVVSRNGNAACYIASITNAAAVCNKE
jgi:hypothetical protein